MDTLGKRVKIQRENIKITTSELAKHVNISQSHISKIERDIISPSEKNIKSICEFFNISADYLIFGKTTNTEIKEEERELLTGYQKLSEKRKGVLEYRLKELLQDQEDENKNKQISKEEVSKEIS